MLLSEINQAVERKLCAGAVEFALDRYQEARLAGSVDAQLAAAETLFQAAKQALAHLYAIQHNINQQPQLGPIGVA